MKLWNEGIACSMPLSEEEELFERSGGLFKDPEGCGDGIRQPCVSAYTDMGFESTYMLQQRSCRRMSLI